MYLTTFDPLILDQCTYLYLPMSPSAEIRNEMKVEVDDDQCDQIGQFIGLWATI